MASEKEKAPVNLKTSDIETDYDNIRKGKYWEADDFDDFVKSIEMTGLQEPVTVRPHPKKQGKYQLVVGHRRLAAILKIAQAKEEKNPTIAARVKKLTDLEARILNGVENNARKDVPPPDQALHLLKLKEEMISDGGKVANYEIAQLAGLSGSHGSKLFQIVEGLKPDLRQKWFTTSRNLPIVKLLEIAKLDADKQSEKFEKLVQGRQTTTTTGNGSGGNKNKWIETQGSRAAEIIRAVKIMQDLKWLQVNGDMFEDPKLLMTLMIQNGFIKPGRTYETSKASADRQLLKAMKDAWKTATPNEPEEDESGEDAA